MHGRLHFATAENRPGKQKIVTTGRKYIMACILGGHNNRVNNLAREVAHARKQNPIPIWTKFCRVVGIPDVITYANFGDDRLRDLGVAVGVKFCHSP